MIDPKELHIGAHVLIGGKRHRIAAIDALNGQIGIDAYTTDANGVKHPFGYKVEDVNPIPLTPELLTELGLELDYEGFWFNDYLEIYKDKEWWCVDCCGKNFAVQYLHQLENFVYQVTKYELIK